MNITAIRNEQNQQPLIQFKISSGFQKTALQDINLNIYPNSIITIVGPNGGGKINVIKNLIKTTNAHFWRSLIVKCSYWFVPQKIHLDHSLPITVERFFRNKRH